MPRLKTIEMSTKLQDPSRQNLTRPPFNAGQQQQSLARLSVAEPGQRYAHFHYVHDSNTVRLHAANASERLRLMEELHLNVDKLKLEFE